jgi:hypothetical protein
MLLNPMITLDTIGDAKLKFFKKYRQLPNAIFVDDEMYALLNNLVHVKHAFTEIGTDYLSDTSVTQKGTVLGLAIMKADVQGFMVALVNADIDTKGEKR